MRISEKLDQWQESLETDSRLGTADFTLPPAAKGEFTYEQHLEEKGLMGFRPGSTQTGLCRYRRWLET